MQKDSSPTHVDCVVSTGLALSATVTNFIQERISKEPVPLLIWSEPVTGPVRLEGFSGVTTPEGFHQMLTRFPNGLPLAEARLFYPRGMLHLVADSNNVHWAAWWETNSSGDNRPLWCPPSGSSSQPIKMRCLQRPVLLCKAKSPGQLQRGLQQLTQIGDNVLVFEYFQGIILRWWRLEPYGSEQKPVSREG
ncbi:MAG: hypothetical protein NZ602_15015 [Thermoguttaceae bacterium]|nr:hypothetical protein [Thermoguttaceae bacterium]MDW8037104.1 hypothetical protein [Thermoguttaceae bacterium]